MDDRKGTPNYPWYKMHSKGWLNGSIREQLTMEERSVWADLLAMANESRERGIIRRAEGIPYTREFIANYLTVPVEVLNSTIEKCLVDKNSHDEESRIVVDDDGGIRITNWEYYQAVPDGKGKLDPRGRELRDRGMTRALTRMYPDEAVDALPRDIKQALAGEDIEIPT